MGSKVPKRHAMHMLRFSDVISYQQYGVQAAIHFRVVLRAVSEWCPEGYLGLRTVT